MRIKHVHIATLASASGWTQGAVNAAGPRRCTAGRNAVVFTAI
jgi:hypothetical protein